MAFEKHLLPTQDSRRRDRQIENSERQTRTHSRHKQHTAHAHAHLHTNTHTLTHKHTHTHTHTHTQHTHTHTHTHTPPFLYSQPSLPQTAAATKVVLRNTWEPPCILL